MPSLTSMLVLDANKVITGEVVSKSSQGVYVVSVQGHDRTIKSAIDTDFPTGTKVLVAKSEGEEYIIGQSSITSRKFTEIIIPG